MYRDDKKRGDSCFVRRELDWDRDQRERVGYVEMKEVRKSEG